MASNGEVVDPSLSKHVGQLWWQFVSKCVNLSMTAYNSIYNSITRTKAKVTNFFKIQSLFKLVTFGRRSTSNDGSQIDYTLVSGFTSQIKIDTQGLHFGFCLSLFYCIIFFKKESFLLLFFPLLSF